jgi:hypothetical protein
LWPTMMCSMNGTFSYFRPSEYLWRSSGRDKKKKQDVPKWRQLQMEAPQHQLPSRKVQNLPNEFLQNVLFTSGIV